MHNMHHAQEPSKASFCLLLHSHSAHAMAYMEGVLSARISMEMVGNEADC